ncbi:hypothetical protein BD779DRAFT_1673753 [Infundibulicybe gibba]|nr:hypothetical protein BD779DRAFT_1673753 [Infundibulicybe gibba]
MRFSTILAFASLALTGFAAPNAKRTIAQVEADIAKISAQVITLDNATLAFSDTGGTLAQALTIHTDFITIITDINTGITDVKLFCTSCEDLQTFRINKIGDFYGYASICSRGFFVLTGRPRVD